MLSPETNHRVFESINFLQSPKLRRTENKIQRASSGFLRLFELSNKPACTENARCILASSLTQPASVKTGNMTEIKKKIIIEESNQ
jgi:hypothetical protein